MNYLTQQQVQDMFNVTRQTIYNWRKKGMECIEFNRVLMFEEHKVNAWVSRYKNKK